METPLAYGRRRLTRTGLGNVDDSVATTASSLQAGPSRLPELTQLVDVDFSDLESDNLESDEHATPRIQALNKLPSAENDLQTPAARLRAILSRVPNGSLSPDATPVATQPPKSVANYESDSDMDISTQVNRAPSAAHTSIRSIFSNALRPPGDTPQKQQQRPRRNSIDTSEVETSPRLERGQHRAKRKSLSLSDEEVENLYRHSRKSQPSFKSKPQHSGLDVLRQRFMNTSGDEGTSQQDGDLSDDTADLLRELNSSRASPPAATSTPQQSMQMSMNSGFQLQSNLLDHDSEMQRFIDNADTYEDFPSKFVEPANASEVEQNVDFPSNSAPEDDPPDTPERPSSPPRTSSQPDASTSRTPAPNHVSTPSTVRHIKKLSSSPLDRPAHARSPRLSLHEASAGSLSRAGSLHSIPGRSPKARVVSSNSSSRSSTFSQAEYRDRMADLDQDHVRERERDWNKPNRDLSRTSSIANLRSPPAIDRQRTQSLTTASTPSNREPYQLPPSVYQALRRHNSLTAEREDSPTHSLNGSQDEEGILPLIVHERERNWMSPRPIWHVARARTSSISSNGSVDGDGDEDYNPPSSASRLTSPRSLAEIRGRINQTIARTPESSPRSAGRFGAIPRDSTSSPSQKRLSSPSILSSAAVRELGASPSGSRTISRSNRLSLPPPAKSPAPATSIGEQSTLRVPRRSLIPVSPRKNRSIRAQPTEPLERHDGTADMDISSSLSDNEWMAQPDAGLQPPAQDDQSSADRTPTLKTVEPPPEDDPPSQPEDLTDNEQRPEEAHYDTDVPSDSDQGDSSAHELPSFTATPPRHAASSSQSRVEPDSPQRSFEVPELPGPPTDESESEGPWSTPAPTRLFPSDPNNTAAKTPKPPGGWLNTPAPRRRSRAYSDSSSQRSNFLAPPSNAANWSAIETPKPPGGWLATPAPKKVEYVDQSVETDTEPEGGPNGFDSSAADTEDGQGQPPQMLGLVTPVSSLPRGKYHNAQTPAAPGAWVQTPAARKSVMKVRFDPQPSDTREFATDTGDESAASDTAPVRSQPETASLQTPPASPEVEQLSPSKRKTPSVRVLDAYGNETREEEDRKMDFSSIKTPRRQPIRFVDALGNAVEDPSVDGLEESLVKEEEGAPAGESREQILSKVKQGLDQLVSEIHDLDCSSSLLKSDLAHIKELDSVSLASREKRRKLVKELGEATAIVKEQAKSLKPANSQPTLKYITSRSSLWSLGFLSLVLLQLLLAGFFYYLYSSWSYDTFLTTYYDPYNPLLHLSTFKSQAASPNLSATTWKSLLHLLRQQDFKAFGQKTLDNIAVHVLQFRSFLWERWGEDVATQGTAWPPT